MQEEFALFSLPADLRERIYRQARFLEARRRVQERLAASAASRVVKHNAYVSTVTFHQGPGPERGHGGLPTRILPRRRRIHGRRQALRRVRQGRLRRAREDRDVRNSLFSNPELDSVIEMWFSGPNMVALGWRDSKTQLAIFV